MRLRDRLEVIGLVCVTEHAVRERRIDGRCFDTGCEDRRLGRSSLGLHVSYGRLARLHLSAGHDRAECVENAVPGLPCDIGGQIAIASLHHVSRKLPRDVRGRSRTCRTLRKRVGAGKGRQSRGRHQPARALQDATPGQSGGFRHAADYMFGGSCSADLHEK